MCLVFGSCLLFFFCSFISYKAWKNQVSLCRVSLPASSFKLKHYSWFEDINIWALFVEKINKSTWVVHHNFLCKLATRNVSMANCNIEKNSSNQFMRVSKNKSSILRPKNWKLLNCSQERVVWQCLRKLSLRWGWDILRFNSIYCFIFWVYWIKRLKIFKRNNFPWDPNFFMSIWILIKLVSRKYRMLSHKKKILFLNYLYLLPHSTVFSYSNTMV